ncbi:caspase family protein [Brunnivagina elsteri]|uniref:Peptidase C14 n=1 Tax=Brunnivagina elsteri CCALA 953 TaxID=987040 RepID=A0A2A2TKK0_9CYAN|nr:caspase family protein [Calothrix elsteri]PAX57115.1 hypothetical protein CK510_09420 [Calothrix elsteri CCALA 953]
MAQRWAFLVGINRYTDPNFGTLKFCVNDVLAIANILQQVGYEVVCLHDELERDSHLFPTRDNVEAQLKQLCHQVQSDDLLWVHFACHGTRVEREVNKKEPVLITRDTRQDLLETRAISLAEVEKFMRDSQARQLVLTLDACHSGVELGRDLTDPEFIRNVYELAEGFALIAASTAQQKAFEWQEKQHGVFTYYLLQGLSGKGDFSGKNFVTVDNLKLYVLGELRRWNIQNSLTQEPTARTEGLGDIILADYRCYPKPAEIKMEASVSSVTSGNQPKSRDDSTRSGLSKTAALQKQMLEEQLVSLSEEYAVVNKQMNSERDARSRLLLKKQADELLEHMKQVEAELEKLN